ncbi:MAG: isoprenylcysteine carboxylmethyltransferase family protein [Cyclobacteriaceae bacterium]
MTGYGLLALGWTIYFAIHSVLAADRVKIFFKYLLQGGFRFYRIIYSLLSTVGLLGLLFLNTVIGGELLINPQGIIRYLSLMLATFGVIIVSRAFKEHDALSFIGFSQEEIKFSRSGILNYVRHPIYSGTILIVIGFFLFTPTTATLLSTVCIFVYLPIGIYLEETKLIQQFGAQYIQYKKEVPSLIPRLNKRY